MTNEQFLIIMLNAPAVEIADIIPPTAAACAAYIGVPSSEYTHMRSYPLVIAKARREWAMAVINESGQ